MLKPGGSGARDESFLHGHQEKKGKSLLDAGWGAKGAAFFLVVFSREDLLVPFKARVGWGDLIWQNSVRWAP